MKLINKLGPVGLIALAASFSSTAFANDYSAWYMGANAGQSTADIDNELIVQNLLDTGFTTTAFEEEENDTGYKVFAGYQFNRYFSLEAGYFDLGKFNFAATTLPAGTLNGSLKVRGVNLDLVGYIPLGESFSLFGRVGANYALTKDNFYGTGAVTVNNPNPSKRETNLKLGVGMQYMVNDSWAVRLEGERYHVNDAVSSRGDIDLVSLGVVYRFGSAPEPTYTAPLPPPAPEVVAPPPPPPTFVKTTVSANELFTFDSAEVRVPHSQLDEVAKALNSEGAPQQIVISGYTDRLGSDSYNQKLSLQRAQGVKNYLVGRGVKADRLIAEGHGESNPVVNCNEKNLPDLIQCLAPNRRVEIDQFTVVKEEKK
jgi:OmpA-OmpF porin, OOP family